MTPELIGLLHRCVVQVNDPDGGSSGDSPPRAAGTGFFIAPGTVLTCGHVARTPPDGEISIQWQGERFHGRIRYISAAPESVDRDDPPWLPPDLALIRLEAPPGGHPCARICEHSLLTDDTLAGCGLRDPFRNGPEVVSTDVLRYTGPPLPRDGLLFLKGESPIGGMSGGPVLNRRSGVVNGIIKSKGQGHECCSVPPWRQARPHSDSEVPCPPPDILRAHDRYHRDHPEWAQLQDALWDVADADTRSPLKPTEEAALLGMLADAGELESRADSLEQLYRQCLPGNHAVPRHDVRSPRDLVFALCDHMFYDNGRLHPVLVLARVLARTFPNLQQDLFRWGLKVAARHGHEELFWRLWEDPSAGTSGRKEPPSVVVALDPGAQPGLYSVRIWQNWGDRIAMALCDERERNLSDTMGLLVEVVPALAAALGSNAFIELAVPVECYDFALHEQIVPILPRGRTHAPVGYQYPVVVRHYDRFVETSGELRERAKNQWNYLVDGTVPRTYPWACTGQPDSADTGRAVYGGLQSQQFGMAPLCVAPGPAWFFSHSLEAAVDAGNPVALWTGTECREQHQFGNGCAGQAFVSAVQQLVASEPITDLPDKLKRQRAGSSQPLSSALLLWDNPYRGPTFTEMAQEMA